jgi:hypothetical protein
MAVLLTVERLRAELEYDRVFENRRSYSLPDGRVEFVRDLEVHPPDPTLPCMYWVFDDGLSFLQLFGFGAWHGHFEDFRTERARIQATVKLARRLMSHRLCIVEELSADGKCWGSGVCRPEEIPATLGKTIVQFRRVFFGRPKVGEIVDHSRYVEEEHIYIEKKYKAKIDRIQKQLAKS